LRALARQQWGICLFRVLTRQCKNGHAACEACCARTHRVCPSCIEPIGDIRCRPLENAIAGMLVPCAFAEHGCTRRLRFAEKPVHEALLCQHAPCACPVPGCAYAGLELRDHIQDAHAAAGDGDDNDNDVVSFAGSAAVTLRRGTPFRVLLHETDGRVFLLLNGGGVPSGRSLSVVCVGPRPGGNRSLEYTLQVGGSGGGEPGALALSASGPVPCTRLWAGHHPTETFLFVPDAYWGSSGASPSPSMSGR
jgi:E3 ubiquitin-protein ligase SIAH1